MSLSDLASLGSFVSGLAVVVTLVFLLLQMRQHDRTLRATMQQVRTSRYQEQLLRPTEPFLCSAVTRATQGDVSMDPESVLAFVRHALSVIWNSEDVYMQYNEGNIDKAAYESDLVILKAYLASAAYRVAWKFVGRTSATPKFRAFVEDLVETTKVAPLTDYSATWKTLMAEELESNQLAV